MKYNVLTYLIGEGFSNIFKNKKQAASSFATMCLIMIFFGLCFILVGNFNHFIKQVESGQGIQAFIVNDATDEEIADIGEQINALDGVNTIEYVSQEQALQSLKDRFKDKAYVLEGYNVKIFKPSYIITLTDLNRTSEVKDQILSIENITKITSSDETISTLVKIARRNKNRKLYNYCCIDWNKCIYYFKYNKANRLCKKKRNLYHEICRSNQ